MHVPAPPNPQLLYGCHRARAFDPTRERQSEGICRLNTMRMRLTPDAVFLQKQMDILKVKDKQDAAFCDLRFFRLNRWNTSYAVLAIATSTKQTRNPLKTKRKVFCKLFPRKLPRSSSSFRLVLAPDRINDRNEK